MNSARFTDMHPDAVTLGAYHDGELRGFARAEVEAHLAACPRCRRDLNDLDTLTNALRSLPQLEPPEIHGAIMARAAATRPRRHTRGRGWVIAAALAALAALAAGYDILVSPHPGLGFLQSAAWPRGATGAASHLSRAARSSAHGVAASGQPTGMQARGAVPLPAGAAQGAQTHGPVSVYVPYAAGGPQPAGGILPGTLSGSAGNALYAVDARLIARVGEVDMRVPDVQRTFNAVSGIATREGGYVADSNNNAWAGTRRAYAATLTLRVPAAQFQAAMNALAALPHGTLTMRSSSQDMTDSYRNLQARLQAWQATRDQLMALMHRSRSIRDAMAVLDRLTAVDTAMDAVQGQIMASATSVMLSTITVNLAPEPRRHVIAAPTRRQGQASGWQPGRDVANAVANLARALAAIITVAIYAMVYLALPAPLVTLALLARRLRRRVLRTT